MHALPKADFKRQVVFRVGAEDWALLEAASREHGSQQAAIIAALRALGGSGPPERGQPEPGVPDGSEPEGGPEADLDRAEEDWWISTEQLRPIVGLEGTALRRRIRQSGAETREGPTGDDEVRLDQIEVDAQHAGELMGVSVDTARRRARAGEMGALARGGGYFFPLGSLEVDRRAAAELLGADAAALQAMIDRGDLVATENAGGGARYRVLDVIGLIE